jgi:hypothetical protein
MRKVEQWFEIRYKQNNNSNTMILKDKDIYSGCPLPSEKDLFGTVHHLAKSKESAERWGESQFGKIYGVRKVNRDDLFKDREVKNNRMIANQKPLGLQIARNVYESDVDLTEMLFGKPKKDLREKKVERKSKWDLISENE